MNYLEIAIECAKEAEKIHNYYRKEGFTVGTKTSHRDRVTTADIESEKTITNIIEKYFPNHNIIGEENSYPEKKSEFTWVIDPLDGTNNYSRDFPYYGVSIALLQNNVTILGVVYNTVCGELFYAERGKGAYLNETRIQVSDTKRIKDSLIITGFYQTQSKAVLKNLDVVKAFFQEGILGLRRTGSAALDLCQIAAGRADIFWEPILNAWDFKAGELIVQEAGGMCTDYSGNTLPLAKSTIVATNKILHKKAIEIINSSLQK
ncbi:inositol monophosphatase family protein [Spirochaetia bacterium 38H-sp]|uniref:Inositol-1-monophosphatase n=1 Tax=Rarispira pelagica TaxID=3141764 RepID=A0ABU9UBG2_9SPIR